MGTPDILLHNISDFTWFYYIDARSVPSGVFAHEGCAVVTFQKLGYPFTERKNKQGNRFNGFRIIFKARTILFMLGSITRDPIFCSKARILLQVKNIAFRSLMITKRLLDVVSCEKKMFKERRTCGSNEGPVKFLSTQDLLSC